MRLFLLAFLLFASPAWAFDYHPGLAATERRLAQGGEEREMAAEAFSEMFKLAEEALAGRGHPEMALRLKIDWDGHYAALVRGALEDTGDHVPLSEWVATWYAELEKTLGVQFMELSHLRDIWVLNFTIPVTFSPHPETPWCTEQLAAHPLDTCEAEYRRHFAGTKYSRLDPFATAEAHHGFAGVVTYWAVWGACQAATYGSGWFVVCTPAGDLAEAAMERWVAPRLSDELWERAN